VKIKVHNYLGDNVLSLFFISFCAKINLRKAIIEKANGLLETATGFSETRIIDISAYFIK